jgi:hypothetical protein
VEEAVRQYKRALEADPAVADPTLSEQLGVRAEPEGKRPGDPGYEIDADAGDVPDGLRPDGGEVVDGRVRARSVDGEGIAEVPIERPKLNFAGVWGLLADNDARSGVGIFFLAWLLFQFIADAVLLKE